MAHRVPSVIVVHRNRAANAQKVHCPFADHNVEKQHQMMNPRAASVVGGTVGAHTKAHITMRRGQHTMSKPSVAPPTPNQQLPSGRHMLIRPPQHDTWPGKKIFYCLGVLYMPIYRPQHYIESLMPWNATNARCRSHGSSSWDVHTTRENTLTLTIPRLLLMERTFYAREHMAQSRGKRVQ